MPLKYFSPTSFKMFETQRQQFVCTYIHGHEREPQTLPMAIGSSFDAHVKSHLVTHLSGPPSEDSEYSLQVMLNRQVNVAEAIPIGAAVFDKYVKMGALQLLMLELRNAAETPRFEFNLTGIIEGDVPISGKPDLGFRINDGSMVIYDWKVNGYCSARTTSPNKGYLELIRENGSTRMHPDVVLARRCGLMYNHTSLHLCNEDWAIQLAMYQWVSGAPIGIDFLVGIDQLVFDRDGNMSIARFRNVIDHVWQCALHARIKRAWDIVQSGHYFPELSVAESDKLTAALNITGPIERDAWR